VKELNPVAALRRQQLSDRIKLDQAELQASPPIEVRIMPVDIFTQFYVPYWRGQVTDEKECQKLFDIWVRTAGGPNGVIHITDANGVVLGISPPAAPTAIFTLAESKKGQTVDGVLTASRHMGQFNPDAGEMHLVAKMAGYVKDMTAQTQNALKQHVQAWQEFLNIFDPKGSQSAAKTSQAAVKSGIDDDLFEF
jgi:hypothetical protein